MKNKIVIIFLTLFIAFSSFIKINYITCYANIKNNYNKIKIEKFKFNNADFKIIKDKRIKRLIEHNKEEKRKLEEKERLAKLEAEKYINMEVPNHSVFKSYMPYSAITLKNSQQYVLQSQAYTDENGLRKIGDYYLVAMGQYYGAVGDKFRITMSSGQQFNVMMGDMKKYEHTFNGEGKIGADNLDLFEFIVDSSNLNSTIRRDGSVNCIFNGNVEKIEREK